MVLISIDTLRADHLPLYGYMKGQTPTLDAFAKDAVVFDRAYAHAPQTLPSHASIMTGLLPFEHGVRDDAGFSLKPNTPTLASLFRQAGYRTAAFVSAYLLRKETGINCGFDTYNGAFPAGSAERPIEQIRRSGADTLAATEQWLSSQTDGRFFLFFHVDEPHMPYTLSPNASALAPYDAEIAYADDIVGKLLDDLRHRGWYDAATIVVLSDHGESLGDHGELEHGLFLYDATMHVPLIAKTPAGRPGRRVADPVQHIDLLPTLASLAHLKLPTGLRGRSLAPLLTGAGHVAPLGIYAEAPYAHDHFGWGGLSSLTDDRYRFIDAPQAELYDLQRDPLEGTNVLTERAQAGEAMRLGLDALVSERGVDASSVVSAEDRERLAALGYVGSTSAPSNKPASTLPDPKDKVRLLMAYRSAIDAAEQDRLVEAAAMFKSIVSQDPDMVDAWSQYGRSLARLGRIDDAIAAFKNVLTRRPTDTSVALDIATLLLQLGRCDEAGKHAELAATAQPAAAHELLARIALAAHDDAGALRAAASGEAADPTLPLTDFVRGLVAYNDRHYAEALPYFTRAYERSESRTMQIEDLRIDIADSLAHLSRYDEAERFFQEEVGLYPGNPRARAARATAFLASGRSADAERTIATMMTAIPTPESYDQAAAFWRSAGQPQRAEAIVSDRRTKFGR